MDQPKVCQICSASEKEVALQSSATIRHSVVNLIKKEHPHWDEKGYICQKDLNEFRKKYIESVMIEDKRQLTKLEKEVVASLHEKELFIKGPQSTEEAETFGQKLADKVASFGGSWRFILIFAGLLCIWITYNTLTLFSHPDPYPYILLNLMLSCLAALQAPIIMMSQNRKEERDRKNAEYDYQVNLKAELEIRVLSEKMDLLLHNQWKELLEVQKIQVEYLESLISKKGTLEANKEPE